MTQKDLIELFKASSMRDEEVAKELATSSAQISLFGERLERACSLVDSIVANETAKIKLEADKIALSTLQAANRIALVKVILGTSGVNIGIIVLGIVIAHLCGVEINIGDVL